MVDVVLLATAMMNPEGAGVPTAPARTPTSSADPFRDESWSAPSERRDLRVVVRLLGEPTREGEDDLDEAMSTCARAGGAQVS